ncbi:hypothetical protein [Lactococcus taiwanensis]
MELSKMLTSFLADCYIQLYNYIKNPLFVNNLELSVSGEILDMVQHQY